MAKKNLSTKRNLQILYLLINGMIILLSLVFMYLDQFFMVLCLIFKILKLLECQHELVVKDLLLLLLCISDLFKLLRKGLLC